LIAGLIRHAAPFGFAIAKRWVDFPFASWDSFFNVYTSTDLDAAGFLEDQALKSLVVNSRRE